MDGGHLGENVTGILRDRESQLLASPGPTTAVNE